ncbi:MAG TPA: F0F1 ATP synthase subunit A [Candidatus Saccharimonadales bacterium]|nr:F0F1 ATP synthase subunit A [Candidatus Saccharimonadales bacterium]
MTLPVLQTFAAEAQAAGPHISIAPQTLFTVLGIPITNSQLTGFIGSLLVLALFAFTIRAMKRGSKNRLAGFVMWMFEILYDTVVEVVGDRKIARRVLPLAITIVFFFTINNWIGIFPFVGAVTWHGHELFRGAAADLNTTLAVAVISIVTAQAWAIKRRGLFGNLHRYIANPFKNPLHAFEGFLELIAEFSRTAALALRVFGNVFGGEVLLAVIAFLTGYAAVVALPVFYVLELFVGAVQAYVFFMLTIAFISLGLPQDKEHDVPGDPVVGTPKSEVAH